MNAGADLLGRLRKTILETAIPLGSEIKFNREDLLHFAIVAKYCRSLELAFSIVVLVENNLGQHAEQMLRGQIEDYVDLKNLISKNRYLDQLELQDAQTQRQLFLAAKRGNPYLTEMLEVFDLDEQLRVLGRKVKEFERRGTRILEIRKKFDAAGESSIYEALYPRLSDSTHGGLQALVRSHTRIHESAYEVIAFQVSDADDFEPQIATSYDAVLRSSEIVHKYFSTGHSSIFSDLFDRR